MSRHAFRIDTPPECRNCGGSNLKWAADTQNRSGVVDGRLRSHDITPIFVLGCDDCSETMAVMSAHQLADALNTGDTRRIVDRDPPKKPKRKMPPKIDREDAHAIVKLMREALGLKSLRLAAYYRVAIEDGADLIEKLIPAPRRKGEK